MAIQLSNDTASKPTTVTRAEIIRAARSWLQTPYCHQASVKGVGCDCLGLIRGIWRDIYGHEPEKAPAYSSDWAEAGEKETLLDAAMRHLEVCEVPKCGDVLAFRWRANLPAKHLGIYCGNERFIHACESGVVCEVSLSNWWKRHIAASFQFPSSLIR